MGLLKGRSEKRMVSIVTGPQTKFGHILWPMLVYNQNFLRVLDLFHDHNKLKRKSINTYNILHHSKVKIILNIDRAQIQSRRCFEARSTTASSV